MADPSNPFGLRDPELLRQWQERYGVAPTATPSPTPQPQGGPMLSFAAGAELDPDSPEAWQKAAEEAGAGPDAVRLPGGSSPNPLAGSNPYSADAKSRGVWTDDDRDKNESAKRLAAHLVANGTDPEEARRAAGVRNEPGQVTVPDDPRKGATPLVPEDQWLPKASTAGVGPTMVSPGGRRPHSWTVQEGLALPETVAAYGQATKSQREAAQAGRDAGVAEAEREVAYLRTHEKAMERHALERRWKEEDRQRRVDAETDKLAEMTDAVKNDQIDNTAFFTGHGVAGGFAAALAYTLGAIGGALTHTENPVIGVIRQEIQTQKDNAALRKQAVEDQKGLLGQLTKTFGDARVGEEAAWIAYLEKAKVQMQRIAGESKDDWVQARYKTAVADIDGQLAGHIQAIETAIQDKVVRQDVNAPPTFIGGGAAGRKDEADPLFVPTGQNGEGFRARSEKEAQAARGIIAAEEDIIPSLERLKELRRKTNAVERKADKWGVWETSDMAEIKSLQAQVANGLRELSATSPGAMDKGMQELAAQIQGDWTSAQGHPEAAADAFITNIRRKKDSMMRGQGAQAQRQGLTYDQRGNIVTKSVGQARFAQPKPPTPKSFKRAE